ncbi:MAG: nitrile hydratase subunit beta [Tateyamaria sp.]|uniref:nitrile hydratase subunit beta n=1 Tax=Tateyamaria sp. TaxID=1929288 RepID=UPI00326AC90D
MTRPHDMGGRFGDGPIEPEAEDVRFHADWHPRALALTLACGSLGLWNIDISRHSRERLTPKDYARFSYYEKWIAGLADLLVEKGAVSRDELATGQGQGISDLTSRQLKADAVAATLSAGGPATRPAVMEPRFTAGDTVVLRTLPENLTVPGGHTRLPAYAAGATGHVVRLHGHHVLPDRNAHGQGDAPEPLYAVAIKAGDLWAHPEHPSDEVILDLWDSYLEQP